MLGQPRTTQRRARKVASDEGALRGDIVRLASRFGRYGYRRVTDMLRIEGWGVNHKRVERIWRQEGLKVPERQPKRGRLWLNDGSCIRLRPLYRGHVWSYDFVASRTHDGRALKLLTVPHELRGELRSVVRPQILGRPVSDEQIGQHLSLQAPVLALELLQAPCLAHLHPAVLPPPPVVRLLGDAELPADQLHGFAAGQTDLCLPQCSDDLLRSVSLPSHPDLLAEKLQTRSILTLHLVSFQRVRSLLLVFCVVRIPYAHAHSRLERIVQDASGQTVIRRD